MLGVAGEIAAERAQRPRQLRGGDPRCAVCARPRRTSHRARKGEHDGGRSSLYAIVDPAVAGGRPLAELAGCVARAAPRWCSCATSSATRAPWSSGARAIKAALEPRAARRSTTASTSRSRRMPTACISAGTTWRPADARRLLGQTRSSGLSVKTVAQARDGAARPASTTSAIGGVYAHDLEGQHRTADRHRRLARRSSRRCAAQARISRSAASPASMRPTPRR